MSDRHNERKKEPPQRSEAANRGAEEREARLAAALRANLGRRKAQARGRDTKPVADDPNS